MRVAGRNPGFIAVCALPALLLAADWASALAQPPEADEPDDGQLQIAIRLPEGPFYAGVPLLLSVEVANNGGTEIEVSKYGFGRGDEVTIVCRHGRGGSFRPPVPSHFEYWDDVYALPSTLPPATTWATLDMLVVPDAGDCVVEATLATLEGQEWAAQPVALTLRPLAADDPYLGVAYRLGLMPRAIVTSAVHWFYWVNCFPPEPLALHQVADAMVNAYGQPRPPDLYEGAWSMLLEAILGVDILTSSPRYISDPQVRMRGSNLIKRCAWFESRFPGSFLLPEVRYRKALLLAAEGRQDEAKALLRVERERSPIARLLYRNLATMSADAARLLKEE